MKITLSKPTRASYVLDHRLTMPEAHGITIGLMEVLKNRLAGQFESALAVEIDYKERHPENLGKLIAFYLVEASPRSRTLDRLLPKKESKIIFSAALAAYGDICVNGIDCVIYEPNTSIAILEEIEKYARNMGITAHAGYLAIA